jgi:hypothetical protein
MSEPTRETFPTEVPPHYSEEAVDHVLEKLEASRPPETISQEKAAYLQRLAAETSYRNANKIADTTLASQAVGEHFGEAAARNVHELALSDTPDAIEGDWNGDAFGAALGISDTAALQGGSADDNLAAVREGISKILDAVDDDAAFDALTANPKASLALVRATEIVADSWASKEFGYTGSRTPEQNAAIEKLVILTARQGLAHVKLGKAAPSLQTRVARARLLVDESFQPGRRGHRSEIVAPVDTPRSIHHALQQNPF